MNAFSLHNKTALITGAASGLGLAMAKCMIVSGAKVIIADLNGELAQATAGTLGSQASWIQMDVGDTAAAQEKVDCIDVSGSYRGFKGTSNVKFCVFCEIDVLE